MNAIIERSAHRCRPVSTQAEAFHLVSELAHELSRGQIELPTIPDVATRVRRALGDDQVSVERLEQIVGSEPVLAARIVQLANSVTLTGIQRRVNDLHAAIARVGFSMVWTTSMAFALTQLRTSAQLQVLEKPLQALWDRSTLVAALCRVVAARISCVNPDTAMFAGLLHGIGELYILARLGSYPQLASTAAGQAIIQEWHAKFTQAILESWEIDPLIATAVGEHTQRSREHAGPADLTDVLTVASLLADVDDPETLELDLADVSICRRLQLTQADYLGLLEHSREQVTVLREALG